MENARTLGHNLKIAHIMTQRKFFEVLCAKRTSIPETSGEPSFRYTGYIFPENKRWLKEQNIDIHTMRCDDASSDSYGYEVHILTPADNITLSEEELTESSAKFEDMVHKATHEALNLFEEMLNHLGEENDEDEDEDEEDDSFPSPYSF